MINPHPPLTGFPIVLVSLLVLLEMVRIRAKEPLRWQQTMTFLVLLIMCFVPLTYFSGYFGEDYAHRQFQVPDEAILQHQVWAKSSFFLTLALSFCYFMSLVATSTRPTAAKGLLVLYRVTLTVLFLLLIRTGFLGGKLVFSHGAGVKLESGANELKP